MARPPVARIMELPLPLDFPPMEAATVEALPRGEEWVYEPKWDGFRCLAFADGGAVELRSKAGKPLGRYFPDMVAALAGLPARRFVLDGELVVPVGRRLDFDQLLLRIHPAASRVASLAREHPARLVAFDLLVDADGTDLTPTPLSARRMALAAFATRYFTEPPLHLSPQTAEHGRAARWLAAGRGGLDGVMAKRGDLPYRSGQRDGMVKVKNLRTAECVVGGFRYGTRTRAVASLLLGLYDADGLLHHVGHTSSLSDRQRPQLTTRLQALEGPPGFTGRAPGGPSRWRRGDAAAWHPVRHELVVEVCYDHTSGGRFRHGTRLLRLRPDKAPHQCTLEQLAPPPGRALDLLRSR